MYRKLRNVLARIKRKIFQGSKYPPEVICLLESIKNQDVSLNNPAIYINLSFDLELALNGKFWRGEDKKALLMGRKALSNLEPICNYLNQENLEYNVQIVAGLLDYQSISHKTYAPPQQVSTIENNQDLFQLNENQKNCLKKQNVDVGIHGFSHRSFSKLDEHQATEEIKEAVKLINKHFNIIPQFMSFPRNEIAHLSVLKEYKLNYRNNKQNSENNQEIPLGLWFSPVIITTKELDDIIKIIKNSRKNYFLHLWQHFTEMNLNEFKNYIEIFKQNDCKIVNLRSYNQLKKWGR